MLENGSLRNCCDPGGRGRLGLAEREAAAAGAPRPAWVVPVLSSVLIFTTVVDILGNLLVILSVFKNRKLRNSAPEEGNRCYPATKSLPNAVGGVKEELLKLAQES
ncbi:melatonin receptor type 1B isoform X3 [Agelaius tricolor]|uniref:melatonin receptor type 1B isoform X3 n=1 Tax=Agelaius tricolor TaxID=9191 RepID=UPI0039F2060A